MHSSIAAYDAARPRALPAPGAHRGPEQVARAAASARAGRDDPRAPVSGLPVPVPGGASSGTGPGAAPHSGDSPASGAPGSAFLAQHIAQEVISDRPGFDAHHAGAAAYLSARDARNEFSRGFAGLDLHI